MSVNQLKSKVEKFLKINNNYNSLKQNIKTALAKIDLLNLKFMNNSILN